jgi:hypothetical protein
MNYKGETMKTIKFNFNGKKYSISEYKICSSWFSKMRGLMFRHRGFKTPLLFVFNSVGMYAIHSFFCRKFLVVWFLEKKDRLEFIDAKIVLSWVSCILPKKKFNLLLEIPL